MLSNAGDGMIVLLFVFSVFMFVLPVIIAMRKKNNEVAILCLCFLLWPAALIIALVCEDKSVKEVERKKARGQVRRPCPECGELIVKSAKVCHYCKIVFAEQIEEINPAKAAAELKKQLRPKSGKLRG